MIEIGYNSLVVRNVDPESSAFKNVMSKFSYFDKVIHKYTFSLFTQIGTSLYFPATVPINPLKSIFPDKEIVYTKNKLHKSEKISYKMLHSPRNELQKETLSFLMSMQEPNDCHQRMVSLPTGSGKTFVTINAIQQIGKKPLIIVDKVSLAEQWKNQFLLHTDLKEDDIHILSGSESVHEAESLSNKKIYIAIHRTLGNMLSENFDSLNNLMSSLKIGIRVFDEAHVEFKNICNINSFSNVLYTIYLTATPRRSQFKENSLYKKVFGSIPYFDGLNKSGENYHTVLLVEMNSHPDMRTQAYVKTKYGFNSARWAQFIAKDAYEKLYTVIKTIFTKMNLVNNSMKTAIVLPTLELIDAVNNSLSEDFPNAKIGVFTGELKKTEDRETALQSDVIITNDKMFDKAIDVPGLEVLINCVQFASDVKAQQMIGRLRKNLEPNKQSIMIDVGDLGFIETVRLFKSRSRFYKKVAKSIATINMNK